MKNEKIKKHTEILKHDLRDEELIDIGRKQSALLRDKAELERQLASVRSDFKAKLERIDSDVAVCTRHISDGFDMRPVECETRYHTPREGWKQTIRLDTYDIIAERQMSDEECQTRLFEEAE